MYYEPSYEIKPNYFLIFIVIISICVLIAYGYTHFQKPIETVIKNESKVIQIEYVTVLVTPTPDGRLYYASEQEEGIRKIQNPFSFYADNASGYKHMKIVSTVYEYKEFKKLTWHNPSDNLDYGMYPQTGKKFLFVFYAMYMDDRVSDDTRFFIPNSSQYVVQSIHDSSKTYYPIEYPKQLRFLELEYARDFLNREQAEYFGGMNAYTRSMNNRETAGEIFQETNILKGGKSNVLSGYVLYEIDDYLKPDELIAGINFYAFGNAWWRLKP